MNRRPPRRNFRSNKSRDGVSERVLRQPRVQEQTHAETLYLGRLIQDKTPVIVKLINDDEISGWIEYYDKSFIRLTRDNAPNVFIYKEQIKFIIENTQRQGR
jgi:sRNA-binding regulator protein Hfq